MYLYLQTKYRGKILPKETKLYFGRTATCTAAFYNLHCYWSALQLCYWLDAVSDDWLEIL